ncbi:Transferase, transferring glycosyl groups protein [Thalictrum thalictroides]|uniref:Transferase, transferring glycosyl groups protein n=1 Tax=Thalictrum thalictroides TaxID=46969 RepID=A0A7J6W968_THATH|nr:Transferase, transferring glycosyl groups protein [Thalictrum thalictroides]
MTPSKRRFLPLLLLFSLSALFILSYHSSFNLFFASHNDTQLPNFNIPQNPRNTSLSNFTLTIKVLAFDRLHSLTRCLRSLANADYGNDRVNLHVYIDHFKEIDLGNGSLILDQKLEESRRILDFVDGVLWKFGDKFVHYRTGNVGLQAQWLEAWWPSSDDEFAFVVEDDLEVSPLFYKFLRTLIVHYYYNSSNFNPSIYGASLQRPRFVPGKHGNKLQLDSETRLFLYQLVGTWGQLLFPRPWKEFRLWYNTHKAKGIKPILHGMVTTGWYKRMGERIWTPWFIKFIHSHGYFNIYTNFQKERALSVSNRDAGVNYGKTAGPDSQLLDERSLDFNLYDMQPLSNLKWYDFCFREVLPGRLVKSFDELAHVLHSVQKSKTIILVNLFGVSQPITMNMLCHFERLDIQNFIFMGPEMDFLRDLARRGHPVIDSKKMLKSITDSKLKGLQRSQAELIQEILVQAYAIKTCLDSGYDSWMIDGNMLPLSSNVFSDMNDFSFDISAMENSKILFVRSSSTTAKIWGDKFIYEIAATAASLLGSYNSLSRDQRQFKYLMVKTLEEKGVRIQKVDDLSFGLKIGADHANQTFVGVEKKLIFWSSEMNLDLTQSSLGKLGMWVVDGNNSCTSVVCHQS